MSKKLLAEKVNTSASYITQLFRGDSLPNFNILAKMQRVLGLKFEIKGKEIQSDRHRVEFEFKALGFADLALSDYINIRRLLRLDDLYDFGPVLKNNKHFVPVLITFWSFQEKCSEFMVHQ